MSIRCLENKYTRKPSVPLLRHGIVCRSSPPSSPIPPLVLPSDPLCAIIHIHLCICVYLCIQVVDRIPLVFQQSSAIARDTGLRMLPLCAETRTAWRLTRLREGYVHFHSCNFEAT